MKKWIASVLLCATSTFAHAWGREGHRLVALVAQDHLSPVAGDNVKFLLGRESMAEVAPWADTYRSEHGETEGWHFVDIPLDKAKYDRDRDCPVSKTDATTPWRDCAVDRIPYFVGQLKNTNSTKEQKAFALKMLIHLVGDLHQPMHAIGDARGGNDVHVTFLGTAQCGERTLCNLHGVWDESIIERRGMSENGYVHALESDIREHAWDTVPQGSPVEWANESHRLAVEAWVPNGALLPREYYTVESVVVNRQLALAGLRLATILNGVFQTEPAAQ